MARDTIAKRFIHSSMEILPFRRTAGQQAHRGHGRRVLWQPIDYRQLFLVKPSLVNLL
jgi:hypothetical protein